VASSAAYASRDFLDYPTFSCEGADDFIVPVDETWTMDDFS
jgi:hypothetical protein